MIVSLAGLDEALAAAHAACDDGVLSGQRLVGANAALAALQRHLDGARAAVAAQIARESRPDLGADGLAKRNGFRSPVQLIAATTGISAGDATRLITLGDATAPRVDLDGAERPARHPHIADAVRRGVLTAAAASAIIIMLDRTALQADATALEDVERTLVARAPGLTLDQLGKLIVQAHAALTVGRSERDDAQRHADRYLHVSERDGMIIVSGKLDPETGAPVKAAIEGIVTAGFRRTEPDAGVPGVPGDDRSVPQRQADALALVCTHVLDCDHDDLPMEGATVVVRMTLEDLDRGSGTATIDGIAQPVPVSTARRMAASGRIIACVLGERSEILDWGREKRLFTRAQRLALVERDGGCAFCGLEPGKTKAHHLRWWARDTGPTDLDNGVLLCESCHHHIHDNGWEIRVDGPGTTGQVWFLPPPDIDPTRTPRLGGKARFHYAA